jgi:GTP-binding protein YchF
MGFKCGIVGLPNVGKSTLFNALTETQAAEAANYPFCTISPNVGDVAVPDERLLALAAVAGSAAVIPTRLTFVDIAGLVRGASRGEGLGNQFLAHIREVDAIAHVLRCFEDSGVTHVHAGLDPLADAETVDTELMLADLQSLERRREPLAKRVQGGEKDALAQLALIDKALELVRAGQPARCASVSAEERSAFRALQLLTAKPVLYVCNVDEASVAGNLMSQRVAERARADGAGCVTISAKIEAECALLRPDERTAFLAELGAAETGLDRLIVEGYRVLDLITFFTVGPKEAHAWTAARGTRAARAAGAIHSDFERGFIRAEIIAAADYLALGGEAAAKAAGRMRLEGKDYVVRDGDVMYVRFTS